MSKIDSTRLSSNLKKMKQFYFFKFNYKEMKDEKINDHPAVVDNADFEFISNSNS